MSQPRHTPQAQALLNVSSRHLLGEPCLLSVQQYQQLWRSAQSQGDRRAQQVLRQQVVAAGRQLQAQRSNPQARALWLALMGLRCSMLMPRLRF
ncbi:hypothetical protein [uncultured Comamonas sp.]|uniref:hypothetical protein n=1 Tax=uncultured Comamonas sp. TaxID=114710 RepID=UPI0026004A71|nr:hypothetical protein [uncultured Comamonas sp.]